VSRRTIKWTVGSTETADAASGPSMPNFLDSVANGGICLQGRKRSSQPGLAPRRIECIASVETPVAVVTSSGARYYLRQIVEPSMPNLMFLAHNEIPSGQRVQSLGNLQ
jgi:hypothetical protein